MDKLILKILEDPTLLAELAALPGLAAAAFVAWVKPRLVGWPKWSLPLLGSLFGLLLTAGAQALVELAAAVEIPAWRSLLGAVAGLASVGIREFRDQVVNKKGVVPSPSSKGKKSGSGLSKGS